MNVKGALAMHRKIRCPECGAHNRGNRRTCRYCGRTLPNRRAFTISMILCFCFVVIVVCVSLVPSRSWDDFIEENRITKAELLSEQIEFGMSKEELVQIEGIPHMPEVNISDSTQCIDYYIKFDNIPGALKYYFARGEGLICMIYQFSDYDYKNNVESPDDSYNKFISDYYFIEDYLTDKYGYQEIQYEWHNNNYERREPNLSQAISDKKLDLCTYRYSSDRYYIEHIGGHGGSSFLQLVILYTGPYYYHY